MTGKWKRATIRLNPKKSGATRSGPETKLVSPRIKSNFDSTTEFRNCRGTMQPVVTCSTDELNNGPSIISIILYVISIS